MHIFCDGKFIDIFNGTEYGGQKKCKLKKNLNFKVN